MTARHPSLIFPLAGALPIGDFVPINILNFILDYVRQRIVDFLRLVAQRFKIHFYKKLENRACCIFPQLPQSLVFQRTFHHLVECHRLVFLLHGQNIVEVGQLSENLDDG